MGVEPTQSCFAGSRLTVWLQRHVIQRPRQESNLVYDLRRVACDPQHSEDMFLFSAPPRNRTGAPAQQGPAVSRTAMRSATPAGRSFKCLDQDLNLDLDLRRVLCDPLHHRDVQRPDLELNQVQGLRRALCDPLHHRDELSGPTTGFAPAWSGFGHRAAWSPAAFLNRATSATQAGVQGFEPCGAALETASSPRRTPL